jgi:exosortase/archaeosortase family protein
MGKTPGDLLVFIDNGYHSYLWRLWYINLNFFPLTEPVNYIRSFLISWVFKGSVFICSRILGLKISTLPDHSLIVNIVQISLPLSASGLKQMIQFIVLMLIIPGSWKNKSWFIPIGIVMIHLTNIFRIICMVIIAIHWPKQLHYAHDNYLRMLLYVVIFIMYIIWVELVLPGKDKSKTGNS